jgi:chromosome segregation ATPase
MALTRKALAAMGIEAEKIEQIMELHLGVVNEIKDERQQAEAQAKEYKTEAEKLPAVQKELDDLKAEVAKSEDFKEKYETVKREYDEFKSEQAAAKRKADIDAAARAYFKDKKIASDENLEIVMRGSRDEINSLELDDDGKIKDTSALDALVDGVYSKFRATEADLGAATATPPANTGGDTGRPSRAAQMAQQFREEHYGTKEE